MTVFDIGANIGSYSKRILDKFPGCQVHCFEPVPQTFHALEAALGASSSVSLNNMALSSESGVATMTVCEELSGSGADSLHHTRVLGSAVSTSAIEVTLRTVDEYVSETGVERIDLMKIDVEGHELDVLHGAKDTLRNGVAAIQFEYGASYLAAGSTLHEVCELLWSEDFKIFRLLPYGKIRIREFVSASGLENYQHSNWVALRG